MKYSPLRGLLAFTFGLTLAVAAFAPAKAEPEGTMVFEYNTYTHIAANGTTTIPVPGNLLSKVCVNTVGASSNTATIYDNTAASGSVVAIIDTTAGTGCIDYDVFLTIGLTVVTATGTAADITVSSR